MGGRRGRWRKFDILSQKVLDAGVDGWDKASVFSDQNIWDDGNKDSSKVNKEHPLVLSVVQMAENGVAMAITSSVDCLALFLFC